MTRSASCSSWPHSRRSESIGIGGLRASTARESWDTAITGISSSRARILSPRLIWPTCSTRLSERRVRADQLEVVHHQQPEAVAGVEAARLGAHLEHADVARVVEVDRSAGQLLDGVQDLRPAVAAHAALPQLVARHLRLRGDEAVGQLGLRHLEREQRHRHAVVDRRVLGDVGGERALAHRGPGGDHDQVAGLEAAGELVEVGEAGRHAGEPHVLARELLELVDLLVEDRLDVRASRRCRRRGRSGTAPPRRARSARAARRGGRAPRPGCRASCRAGSAAARGRGRSARSA